MNLKIMQLSTQVLGNIRMKGIRLNYDLRKFSPMSCALQGSLWLCHMERRAVQHVGVAGLQRL